MKRLFLDFGWSACHAVAPQTCSVGQRLSGACWRMCLLVFVSACSFAPTWPDLPLPENITRESIDELRTRADARLSEALRECYQRFAVNDCRREAMERHRELMHTLRTHELRLNALDREARQRRLAPAPEQRP
jgi:hypothetical protein